MEGHINCHRATLFTGCQPEPLATVDLLRYLLPGRGYIDQSGATGVHRISFACQPRYFISPWSPLKTKLSRSNTTTLHRTILALKIRNHQKYIIPKNRNRQWQIPKNKNPARARSVAINPEWLTSVKRPAIPDDDELMLGSSTGDIIVTSVPPGAIPFCRIFLIAISHSAMSLHVQAVIIGVVVATS